MANAIYPEGSAVRSLLVGTTADDGLVRAAARRVAEVSRAVVAVVARFRIVEADRRVTVQLTPVAGALVTIGAFVLLRINLAQSVILRTERERALANSDALLGRVTRFARQQLRRVCLTNQEIAIDNVGVDAVGGAWLARKREQHEH